MRRLVIFLIIFVVSIASAEELSQSVKPQNQEISPLGQPIIKNGVVKPYLTADFIYWKAREDGLTYIATGLRPNASRGKFYEIESGGHIGFKVGLGLNIIHDSWDIYLQYTYLHADEADSFNGEQGLDLLGDNFLFGGVKRARANWDLYFNAVDLEWGREFYVSQLLLLRPFFGLKGNWSDQDFKVKSAGFIDLNRQEAGENQIHFNDDSWGVGIRGGLQTTFSFTQNWSFFGNFVLAAQWSRFYLKLHERGFSENTQVMVPLIHFHNREYRIVPVLELALGIRWQMKFSKQSRRILVQAGWEEQIWWGYADAFAPFNRGFSGGNLNFQGLTLRAHFDF